MFWTEKEAKIISDNRNLTIKQLCELLPNRSHNAIAQIKRKYLNTANSLFKKDWVVPSKKLAYFMGIVCSAGCINKYTFTIVQVEKNKKVIDRVEFLVENLFGLKSTVKRKGKNYYLTCSSFNFLKEFGSEEAIANGNLKLSGEWFYLLEDKFKWILENDDFFWAFISGLMDGDGSLVRKNALTRTRYIINLAVFAMDSSKKLLEEFLKRGFHFVFFKTYNGLNLVRVAEVDSFLEKIDCVLVRKNDKTIKGDKELVVNFISQKEAKVFLSKYHYLKTVPVSVNSYGLYRGSVLLGVASVSKYKYYEGLGQFLELRRFALSINEKNLATKFLSRLKKKLLVDFKGSVGMISYSDLSNDHKGIIYKAFSSIYLGRLGSNKYFFSDGSVLNGRFIDSQINKKISSGLSIVKSEKIFKEKYLMIFVKGGLRNKIVRLFKNGG